VSTVDYATYVRWYPAVWRERYGTEFVALLEETYQGRRVPFTARLSIVRAGSVQRARAFGALGESVNDERALLGSAVTVSLAWSLFGIAGSVYAHYVEHWQRAVPKAAQTLPTAAYDTVFVASFVGLAITVGAAMLITPALVRARRRGAWRSFRRPLQTAIIAVLAALTATFAVVLVAHHVGAVNATASWPLRIAFYACCAVVTGAVVTCTSSLGIVTSRLDLSRRVVRSLGALALSMSVTLGVIFAGILVWWVAVACDAPWFFASGAASLEGNGVPVGSVSSPSVPWLLAVVGITMVTGLLLAGFSSTRIVRRLRHTS